MRTIPLLIPMLPHVVEAKHLEGYRVWVKFIDGASGELDLSDELDGPVFEPLKDPGFFHRFSIRYNTLSWENGADFAPEVLGQKLAEHFKADDPLQAASR